MYKIMKKLKTLAGESDSRLDFVLSLVNCYIDNSYLAYLYIYLFIYKHEFKASAQ
jgi:hypothetical protein